MIILNSVLLKLNKKVSLIENKIAVERKLGIIKIEKGTNTVANETEKERVIDTVVKIIKKENSIVANKIEIVEDNQESTRQFII
jgi:hypothetical protein